MASWGEFSRAAPDMAAFGAQRLGGRVAYLATVRKDGGPRVHPVTPIISAERLFVFMEPTSPKGFDLRRDGRYSLHCAVEDNSGGAGEIILTGRGRFLEDEASRAEAIQASSYKPHDRYILFELTIESAASTLYVDNEVKRQRWAAE